MPKLPAFANWRRLKGDSPYDALGRVGQRFLHAFEEHGVEVPQIPRLLPDVGLDDLRSPDRLLAVLTPEVLDKAAQLLGIRVEWLEGVDDRIYAYRAAYKRPQSLLEDLAEIPGLQDWGLNAPLRVLTTTMELDRNKRSRQLMAPVLLTKVAELGDEELYRYRIYQDGFDWGYEATRLELKAIARIASKTLHTNVPLFRVSKAEMTAILEGRMVPGRSLWGPLLTEPSLEDYVLSNDESVRAREVEELPEVLTYIESHRLQDIFLDALKRSKAEAVAVPTGPGVPAETPEVPTATGHSGKRQALRDAWEEARAYARGRWAEDASITIEDMVRRIKKIRPMKASAYSESGIRKHIADLAPAGVRGKPGRKPKKSP